VLVRPPAAGQRYEPASGKAVTSKEATFNGYDALLVKDGNKTSYFMLKNMDVFEVYKTGKEKSLNGILGTFMFLD